ncbi:hypothetical protein OIU77_010683 [Salix suchowensis]|uniref:DUF4005 domain-containing protein n=1 Tax=Salix suchowensis TaxID=1278906 RepID=A0ABQ9AA89_9ROSI|nr:hypothetical protein OIU77_010683 [Salix suchowensis]
MPVGSKVPLPMPYLIHKGELLFLQELAITWSLFLRSVERPSHSDAKYSTTSYTRNTPRISPSSIFSGNSGNIRGSPKVLLGESVNMSSAKAEYAKDITSPSCAEIPRKGVELLYEEAPGSKKQKTDVWCSSSKSQKMNHDAQAYVTGSPSVTYTKSRFRTNGFGGWSV